MRTTIDGVTLEFRDWQMARLMALPPEASPTWEMGPPSVGAADGLGCFFTIHAEKIGDIAAMICNLPSASRWP
jgi:hypothetical protein